MAGGVGRSAWAVEWDARTVQARSADLAALLHACVHAGASISFVLPFPPAEASAWWTDVVAPLIAGRRRVLLVVEQEGQVLGAVQLDLDTPPNQAHRAGVTKLLVHPDARRRGLARHLMVALHDIADQRGRTLITLDTTTGSPAQALYASLGYVRVGEIPDFAAHVLDGHLEPTTIMYRSLGHR
ncbi:MAG TPA: GNAT family N-acetyltransferase [Euzebya sp.]|nr:GNAT family N-acetyltransferase [Euzebya sp.]